MEFIPLVDFIFETNPLHKVDIDQCITAVCQPLEIIYDSVSCYLLNCLLLLLSSFTLFFFYKNSSYKNHKGRNRQILRIISNFRS